MADLVFVDIWLSYRLFQVYAFIRNTPDTSGIPSCTIWPAGITPNWTGSGVRLGTLIEGKTDIEIKVKVKVKMDMDLLGTWSYGQRRGGTAS